jgi:integration host factor subunit beta
VTKSELIAEFAASNPHLRQEDVELVVTIFDQIAGALARGDRVELRGFGAFTAKWRRARTGRNPRSGEEVPVSEKVLPYFRISRKLHRRLNRSDAQDRAASTVRTARRRLRLGHQHGEEVAALATALLHHPRQRFPRLGVDRTRGQHVVRLPWCSRHKLSRPPLVQCVFLPLVGRSGPAVAGRI